MTSYRTRNRREAMHTITTAVRRLGVANLTALMAETSLSRPAITAIVDDLVREGLLEPTQNGDAPSTGRPAAHYRISRAAGITVACEVTSSSLGYSVASLAGDILHAEFTSHPEGYLLDAVARRVTQLAGDHAAAGELRSVCIATTGVVDADGRVTRSDLMPSLNGLKISEELSERLGVPVRAENDINAAALAEFINRRDNHGLTADADLLYLRLGHGLNTGMVIGGHLHRGAGGAAGEISDILSLQLGAADEHTNVYWVQRAAVILGTLVAAFAPDQIVLSAPTEDARRTLDAVVDALDQRPAAAGEIDVNFDRYQNKAAMLGALVLGLGDALAHLFEAETPRLLQLSDTSRLLAAPRPASDVPDEVTPTDDTPLNVGIVGVGHRSYLALKVEEPQNAARLAAACDPHPNAANRMQRAMGRSADEIDLVPTMDEFLGKGLDAALVITPEDTHAEVTLPLLEAGIPTYLEKPLEIDLGLATDILETAMRTGTKLYVGHNMRHMGLVKTMRDIIRSGRIGEVKAIWCRHFVGNGGDYYFKDWHAEREHSLGLLLQKAAHDIDVMHWLADSRTEQVVAMGGLTLYDQVKDRTDRSEELQREWFSLDNWPPLTQKGLNPVIDVEDLSMMLMRMESGVFASYQQCHYTPDYWRNYTVIGTEGRLENFGDGAGGVVKVWNRKRTHGYAGEADEVHALEGDAFGHDDADSKTVHEFLEFVRKGIRTDTSPVGAWNAVAAGIAATESLRDGSTPRTVPALSEELIRYFSNNQSHTKE